MPFIVLEGLDGAGKSTQIKKIRELIESNGREVEMLHFPRFDSPFYGELIARFLRGEFGSASEVDPYLVALLYAGDRKDAAEMIASWLSSGKYVIADRYVCSNIAYQCAKIDDPEKRERLTRWILDLEFTYNSIPRPDINLFLDVPFGFTRDKLTSQRQGEDREYLKGATDIHEASLTLQERVREVYIYQAHEELLSIVDCSDNNGNMLSPEDIFERIKTKIKDFI
jgi:dTMP kinase